MLTKTTPTARSKFSSQIRAFLQENRSFDECLAVRLAAETREWGCLAHLAGARGLAREMVDAVGAVAVGGGAGADEAATSAEGTDEEEFAREVTRCLKEMSAVEREGLLSCLLHKVI